MEHIQVDLFNMPENPKTKDKYVLTIRDYFTKYIWAFKFVTKEASNYAQAIINFIMENDYLV